MSLPLQKATYPARAVSISFGVAQTGTRQIAVGFEVSDTDPFGGERITWIGHFTDGTAARTIESLQHAGWQGDDLSELDGLDEAGVRAALPEIVELACELEVYDEKQRLKVQWVNKHGGTRFAFAQPLEGHALKAFAAQLRATVQSVRASGGAPRRGAAGGGAGGGASNSNARPIGGAIGANHGGSDPHPNAPGNRDDIPF